MNCVARLPEIVKKPARLYEYITGSWRPLSGSRSLRHQLAHHLDHRHVVAREQQALLAVGRESTCRRLERQRVRGARSPPRRGTACRTRSSSAAARSACGRRRRASSSSRAGPCANGPVRARGPGPDGAAVVVEHADQRIGQVGGVAGGGICRAAGAPRRRATGAGRRNRSRSRAARWARARAGEALGVCSFIHSAPGCARRLFKDVDLSTAGSRAGPEFALWRRDRVYGKTSRAAAFVVLLPTPRKSPTGAICKDLQGSTARQV